MPSSPLGLLGLVCLLAGCASLQRSQDPTAGESIRSALARSRSASIREPDPELVARMESDLERAESALADGRPRAALEISDALLNQSPPSSIRSAAMALRRRAREYVLETEVLVGRCVIERERVEILDPIEVRIELENVGDLPVRIPRQHRTAGDRPIVGESVSVFLLDVEYRDWDWAGSTVVQQQPMMLAFEEDVVLEPGETHRRPIQLGTEDPFFRPDLVVYRRISVGGHVQPVEILSGDSSWFSRIRLARDSCELMPKGLDPILSAPVETLDRAMDLARTNGRAANHVFFSAILAFEREPAPTARRLIEGLSASRRELVQASLSALRLLSGRAESGAASDFEQWIEGLPESVVVDSADSESPPGVKEPSDRSGTSEEDG